MNRELNELKSRAINRTGFIGTVINMPQASLGVGSGIVSMPRSLFATKKGKEILRLGPCSLTSTTTIHHHMTKAPAHTFQEILERRRTWEQGNLERPSGIKGSQWPTDQLHLTEELSGERGAAAGTARAHLERGVPSWGVRAAPHPLPGLQLSAAQMLIHGKSCLPTREMHFISSSGIHTITGQLLKKAPFLLQSQFSCEPPAPAS